MCRFNPSWEGAIFSGSGCFTFNKQINALQEEVRKLRKDISYYASLNRDATRDYHEMVLGGFGVNILPFM